MSIPVREIEAAESDPSARSQRQSKQAPPRTRDPETIDREKEDTVRISREARNRRDLENDREGPSPEKTDSSESQNKLERNRTEESLAEKRRSEERIQEKQKNEENEKRAELVQREQRRRHEEDWNRIEDERIEDRKFEEERERQARLETPPETERQNEERTDRSASDREQEIRSGQEDKIEEEKAVREEDAEAAKAFTASYTNNPASPGNIINLTA